ncbi:MAG: glutathione peroxidase [Clostridia bacterium]|jgi:glutathione peroxidase|nr:glutathione peroxidase [Clostridia bacterium]
MNLYDFTVQSNRGDDVSLSDYAGKVLLIVNTASKCGYTPQFDGLQKLYDKYKDQGLVILGFPCNQFAHQDPGTDAEILSFCQINYGVTFPMFKKIKVNGKDADPLFGYLKEHVPDAKAKAIRWNFTKFLIDRKGAIIGRYDSKVTPADLDSEVAKLL